jgi:uncharacterized protein YbjT (DUF2867 family)
VTAITGSTGVVGGLVAAELAASGSPLRLIVRDPSRAPQLDRSEVRQATYGDKAAALAALAGVDVLFMVSAAENEERLAEHLTFVDAAAEAGVAHIVYTSFLGAAPDATFTLARDHFATEERIRASGMAFTILRDAFYLDFMPLMVGDDGVMRGPAGDGRAAIVARSDVARVAVRVLENPPGHAGATYDLTGPEALTLTEVTAIIAEVTGRPATFHHETIDEAYASRAPWNAPGWQVDAWVSTYTAIAEGTQAAVSDDVERVTGEVPLSLRQYLETHSPTD